ncbi:MAG: DUF255 domain-containing protein, partial [Bdellovibrionales bacterium]|nr:DUF255 domain-containing protein [Bdellovibrionales bacterium]
LNRPIFLSIGYSSCHWCHVMAHESFVDPKVAEFLNENFTCIKVDREEFPDIDNYYQKAAQLFGSNGGWPLSAFLLPDTRPFFVGTYYPLTSKGEAPNFPGLITELKRAYDQEKDQVEKNAIQVTEAIKKGNIPEGDVKFEGHFPPPNAIMEAVKEFRDETWGGYGSTPKFPMYAYYEWALEQMLEGMLPKEHGEFVIKSLEAMLMGGMNDHARGGVHRYSTDEKWLVPHFEKMLYDQAGFLKTITKLSLVYPSPLVFDSLVNTLDYIENEMLSEDIEGRRHFFSAQDADSEGVEGLYFTFSEQEFEDLINNNDDEAETLAKNMTNIKKWFQITPAGNFEHGLNVISLNPAHQEEYYLQENWDIVRKVRRAITNERKERMPPATDNKGVASWNFMMISALVDVVQYSQIEVIKRMASTMINTTIEGIFKTFLINSDDGMKMRHTTTVDSSHPYLEDFVFFAESQLRLYEISANEVFKQNFKDALEFVTKEFLTGEQMSTRAKMAEYFEQFPNQDYTYFDSSFKSPVATYVQLMRRAAVLFSDRDYNDTILKLQDIVSQTVLKVNPVSAGEALRALTYPTEAFRVMKVPKLWAQREDFIKFIPYFLPRFVLDYHDEKDTYEICTMNACELKGETFEEFIKVLMPPQAEG